MLDRVLNTPLNTIKKIFLMFPNQSQLLFYFYFSTINFSYQYLTEAKVSLEPSRTFYGGNIFFCKIHKKTPVLESHFNKVTGLYLAKKERKKEMTSSQVFLVNFARYLRQPFYRTPPATSSVLRKKYFTNKIAKKPLRKEKNIETACKKNNHTGKTKT